MAPAAGLVRRPASAGTWYPAGRAELAFLADSLLAQMPPEPLQGRLVALLAPHASYLYSGSVAAAAYRHLRGRLARRVIVLGPSHHPYGAEVVVPLVDVYETPLGFVPVDRSLLTSLADRLRANVYWASDDTESSIELQLPFLQRALGAFELVPLMFERHSLGVSSTVARALVETLMELELAEDTLLVASSDLSHARDYRTACRLDWNFLGHVCSLDAPSLMAAMEVKAAEACAAGAVTATLLAARALGARRGRVLAYANSGDVTGDLWSVVGYAAAAVLAGAL